MFERVSPNGDSEPTPTDIIAAINRLVDRVTRFEEYLAGRVAAASAQEEASSAGRDRMHAELGLYRQALTEARKLLLGVGRLGLDAMQAEADRRRARFDEEDGRRLYGAIDRILCELGVRDDPRVPVIVPRELRALAAGNG